MDLTVIFGGHEIGGNLGGNVNLKQPEIGGGANLNLGSGFNNNMTGGHQIGGNLGGNVNLKQPEIGGGQSKPWKWV